MSILLLYHIGPMCGLLLVSGLYHCHRFQEFQALPVLEFRDRLERHLVPSQVHQDRITGAHSAFDEVVLTTVADLVELAEASHLSGNNPLLASDAFCLLIVPSGHTSLCDQRRRLEDGLPSSGGNHSRIKNMLFGQVPELAMLLGDKAPCFFCLQQTQQLKTNAVHLRCMQQRSFFLPFLFQRNLACMLALMAGLTEREQVAFFIASLLAPKDNVMHF